MQREPQFNNSKAHGWFKAMRSDEAIELIRLNPNCFMLAYFIASRARYQDGFNADGLAPGEALLGDYQNYGMSERQYRTAKQQLQKFNFATFRTTSKGTIGKLMDTRLFDPLNISNDGQNDTRPTDRRRAADGRPTTNKKDKKDKKEKNGQEEVSADGVSAEADPFLLTLELEEEMQKIVNAEALTEDSVPGPWTVPSDDEVWAFAERTGLDLDAVEKFLFDRSIDGWFIKKHSGLVTKVKYWQPFLTSFCEKFVRDREGQS